MPFAAVGGAIAAGAAGAAGAGAIGAAAAGALASGVIGSLTKGGGQSGAVSGGQDAALAAQTPYTVQGTQGLNAYTDLLGLNGKDAATTAMGNFTASPGYQYQLDQGLRAVDAGAASKGMLRSGATIKAEQDRGNNLAAQDFGTYTNRLASLAGIGQTAANNTSAINTNAATQQASIYGNQVSGVTGTVGSALGNSSLQNGLTGLWNNSSFNSDSSASAGSSYNYNPSAAGYTADTSNLNGLIQPLSY